MIISRSIRVSGGPSGRSFLPITSLASHTCTSNSLKDKTTAGWVITRAKLPIKKGEEVTFHYTGGLKGRLIRRKALKKMAGTSGVIVTGVKALEN